jgi:polysaccharide pyruvyl transferase WcaK-like protein
VPERNRGDQALLDVVLHEVERRGLSPVEILTTSNQPIESFAPGPQREICTDLYPVFLTRECFREELRFISLVGRCRELLMIGADVLDEGYSVERSISSMHALELACKLGVKARIFGFSVNGRPSEGLRQRLKHLGKNTQLCVRDPESYRRLSEAGVEGIRQVGDLAFLLEPADAGEVPESVQRFSDESWGRLIGLNLTEVVFQRYGQEQQRLEIVAEACAKLAREDDLRFLLIPHDEPEGLEYLRNVAGMIRARAGEVCRVVDPLPHCRVLKRIAGMVDHLFTCRLHLGIAALGMGRPITGFPYQGKWAGQFELFGLSEEGLVGPDRFPESPGEMAALMRTRIADSQKLAEQVQSSLPAVLELSRKNFDGLGN